MTELIRIGIDTGGTFTDFVVARGSSITAFKVPSTPRNPEEAILNGVVRILNETGVAPSEIVHGTTVATNALLERKGARTALITTEGFEDVIEIGRQARPELYNFMVTRRAPLVPRELRFGATERIGPDGSIITALDESGLQTIIEQISKSNPAIESIAVCLLFSFANPSHEQAIARALEPLAIPVSLSHRILPEYREYERTSTTVINAYLVPLMSRYLRSLAEGLESEVSGSKKLAANKKLVRTTGYGLRTSDYVLRIMQSNGGSVSAATAAAEPVRAILSGPAGGVVGALRVCAAAGIRDIITFDMGGTSTDVALCRGEARTTNEATVAGLPVAVPIIDIHTVGAGGGSIARVDEAGALRVGPESAGADPGPACYGRGEQVTVTDANLVLGRFGGAGLLGGEMKLDEERARFYLSKLADEMSRFAGKRITAEQAALGVVRVANANMESALRVVSVERGQDPRLFSLVSFGGAGGLHVCELAQALRIPRVVVPRSPGTLSALGVLLGDVVKDYSRTVMMKVDEVDRRAIERGFRELEREAARDLAGEGFSKDKIKIVRSVAMRYVGQSFEIDVRWGKAFERAFHAEHRERYGYADAKRPTEIVSLRVRAIGVTDKPRSKRMTLNRAVKVKPAYTANVYLAERAEKAPVYLREDLKAGARLRGPAIITEYSSTTLIPPGRSIEVDAWLNLIIA
ncbi:MAG TPA: hydantoinase/oxoprolinase family protein [Blastocatellia bacterium]|nr:hydantoinase/oxoprolinase family protein [Blastocatellia bacterium]